MTKKLFFLLLTIGCVLLPACREIAENEGFSVPKEGFSISLRKTPDEITPYIPEIPDQGFSGHNYRWKYKSLSFTVNAIVDPMMYKINDLDEALTKSSGIEDLAKNPDLTIESSRLADFNGLRGFEYIYNTVKGVKLIGRVFIVGKKQRYLVTAAFDDAAKQEFAIQKLDTFTAVVLEK